MKVYLTAKDTENRIKLMEEIELSTSNDGDIKVDSTKTYQEIIGFGGALTESAAVSLSKVSEENREKALTYYYSEEGLNYNMGRVHIHSCDFALGNYTYIDEGDESLESFSIDHDRELIIPLIKDAVKIANKPLKMLASPWSPPAFMKTNKEMNHGGKLLAEYASAWAKYYVKFIKAYAEEGIEIESITVQNEPAATQIWDSCIYSPEEEGDFVKNHLGPELEKAGLSHIKIYIVDHNRDLLPKRPQITLSDPDANKYIYGTAIHWYVSEEFENLSKLHDLFPDKHLLFSEGCHEGAPMYTEDGEHIDQWSIGERYARNILNDFLNWNEGYLDWNIVLDETGGPNHVSNFCEAPIIADTKKDVLYINSSYYYIGHFSKFVKPNAKRIGIKTDGDVSAIGFKNTDDSIVIVVLNETDNLQSFRLNVDGKAANYEMPAHSIATFVI